jgi:hypothetical protein
MEILIINSTPFVFPHKCNENSHPADENYCFRSEEKAFQKQNYANFSNRQNKISHSRTAQKRRSESREKHEFILRSFHSQCTTLHYRTVHSRAVSNISSFQLEGCDILVLTRKTFLVGKFSFICHHIF